MIGYLNVIINNGRSSTYILDILTSIKSNPQSAMIYLPKHFRLIPCSIDFAKFVIRQIRALKTENYIHLCFLINKSFGMTNIIASQDLCQLIAISFLTFSIAHSLRIS